MVLKAAFAVPGDLATRTGGYIYDRRVMELLPARGVEVRHLQLPASFPSPSPADLERTDALLQSVPASEVIVADGLAWGAIPPEICAHARARVIAICHHPLGLEEGLPADRSRWLIANERAALAVAAHVVVPSRTTAETLVRDFAVPQAKIKVAEPGTERAARSVCKGHPPVLFAAGSLIPRKGYDILIEALAGLPEVAWKLVIAGSPERDPHHAASLVSLVKAKGLSERISFAGEIDDTALQEAYASADVFVSSSRYEGYGMVLTEAIARGLPVVTTTGGAAGDTVPDSAGLKVPPGDTGALREALRLVLEDSRLRRRLSDGAWMESSNLPTWEQAADAMANVIRTVAAKQDATA